MLPSTATPDDFSKCRRIIYGFICWGPAIVSSLRKHALTQNKVNKLNWDLASAAPSLFLLPPLITLLGVRGTES